MGGRCGHGGRGTGRERGTLLNAPQPNVDPLAAAIRRLHTLGLSLIPIKAGTKAPRGKWKDAQTERRSVAVLTRAMQRNAGDGLGVVLGSVSGGLCCRDFDDSDLYGVWAEAFPDWARVLPTVATARGFHVYFRMVDPVRVRKVEGGEVRGDGGYTVLPPSVHPSGVVYRWAVEPDADGFPLVDPLEVGLCKSESAAPSLKPTPIDPIDPIDPVDPINARDAIERCAITGAGMHDRQTLTLARILKLHTGIVTVEAARSHFETWWTLNKAKASDDDYFLAWDKFERAWSLAVQPIKGSVQRGVLARIDRLPPVAEEYGDDRQRRLVRALAAIHRRVNGGAFLLSAAMVGKALGCSMQAAQVRLKHLERQGRIVVVHRGWAGEGGKGRARTLRFVPLA